MLEQCGNILTKPIFTYKHSYSSAQKLAFWTIEPLAVANYSQQPGFDSSISSFCHRRMYVCVAFVKAVSPS